MTGLLLPPQELLLPPEGIVVDPDMIRETIAAIDELVYRQEASSLIEWEAYPTQRAACTSWTKFTALFGGNQCLGGEQMIFDPVAGVSRRVDEIEEDFHVEAWTGNQMVVAKAKRPYKKPKSALYRVTFEDGTEVICSAGHLFLGPSGWTSCGDLSKDHASAVSLPRSNSGTVPSVRPEDAARWLCRALDSLSGCPACRRSCGVRPPADPASGQDAPPSRDGALGHSTGPASHACGPSDGQGDRRDGSRSGRRSRLQSSLDADLLISAPFVDSESRASHTASLPSGELLQVFPQLLHGSCPGPQSILESAQQATLCQVSLSASLFAYSLPNQSVARIDYLRIDDVWDFEVEGWANYFIGSVLNHNSGKTTTGLRRAAWDLTGIYPPWYNGPRTEKGISMWIVGESSDLTRDGLQKKLLGPDPKDPGKGGILSKQYIVGQPVYKQNGGGAIDYIKIRHITGQISILSFRNYSQGEDNLQSVTLDRLLVDEEPPFEAWVELLMRVSEAQKRGDGYVLICFTPKRGKSKVVGVLLDDNPDVSAFFLSAEEAKHLGPEHVEKWKRILKNDPAALKARLYGLPDINSGLVWNAVWSDHRIPRFPIDPKWPRIGSIDFGWTHKTAILEAAIDPSTDTVFVYKALGVAKTKAWEIAKHMRAFTAMGYQYFGDPSAEQPDKSSGKALLDTYLDELLPGWESVPPEERPIRKAPRTPQVRVEMVQKRLDQGSIYFFDDLDPVLFREVEDYSYDKKGRLPEEDDDFPDALGYLVQCASAARRAQNFRPHWRREAQQLETCLPGY